MSKECEFYRQCLLVKGGNVYMVSWIPDCFANVGWTLKLKNEEGIWVDGWEVRSASEPSPAKYVEHNSRAYLRQRDASDIVFNDIKKANAQANQKQGFGVCRNG